MKTRLYALSIIILGTLLLAPQFSPPTSMAEGKLAGVKVCLDPGHGGDDPGAVNEAFGLHESDINLDVSYGLKTLLEDDGAEVAMTRTSDQYRTNADRYTFCNDEQATILVSVHANSVTDASWDGSMTLYAPSADDALAQAIHPVMYDELLKTAPLEVDEFRDFGLDRFASGVLFKCDMPAAMVEPLFMSNEFEAPLLTQTITGGGCEDFLCRRGQIAYAVYRGILNYFVEPPPEPSGAMHVAAIEMWYQSKGPNNFVYTLVTVHDGADPGNPVPGVTVSLDINLPQASSISETAITGEDGSVTFQLRSNQTGTFETTVTGLFKESWKYDAAANLQTSQNLTVP